MAVILIVAVLVVVVVLLLSVFTVNKGYSYKHTVDRAEDSPYQQPKD
ncbi:YtzI protein [Ectobacillus sp. JY-23]|nr:YtzI protein [Ectobacillus sp. JY-23]UOY94380.1 YtzI protein [Ectobacillus sp. JY-23]